MELLKTFDPLDQFYPVRVGENYRLTFGTGINCICHPLENGLAATVLIRESGKVQELPPLTDELHVLCCRVTTKLLKVHRTIVSRFFSETRSLVLFYSGSDPELVEPYFDTLYTILKQVFPPGYVFLISYIKPDHYPPVKWSSSPAWLRSDYNGSNSPKLSCTHESKF